MFILQGPTVQSAAFFMVFSQFVLRNKREIQNLKIKVFLFVWGIFERTCIIRNLGVSTRNLCVLAQYASYIHLYMGRTLPYHLWSSAELSQTLPM